MDLRTLALSVVAITKLTRALVVRLAVLVVIAPILRAVPTSILFLALGVGATVITRLVEAGLVLKTPEVAEAEIMKLTAG